MTGAGAVQVVVPGVVLLVAWLMPSLTGPTLPFGVRTPPAHAGDPVIGEQRRSYRRRVGILGGAVLAAELALSLAFPGTPLAGGAAVVSLAVCTTAYLRARRAIRAVKHDQDWYAGLRQVVTVDTSLRTEPVRYPWLWSGPSLLVLAVTAALAAVEYPSMPSRVPMHYGTGGAADRFADKSVGTTLTPVFIQLAVTVLLLLATWLTLRARAELDPADPAVSASRHRRFVVRTTAAVLLMGACVNLAILAAAWQTWHDARRISPALVLAPVAVGLLIVLATVVRTGRNGSRLAPREAVRTADGSAAPDAVAPDDDRFWRAGGLVYVNRQDSSILVAKRFGVGWTVNFGNPRFLWLLAGLAAFIAVLRLIGH